MSTITTEYCAACGGEREFHHEQRVLDFEVRGEILKLDVPVKVCAECDVMETDGVDPAGMAFAKYREMRGLLSPGEIKAARKQYGLSQKAFAALLGMSEASINRYERGGLQEQAHDQAIRSCLDPSLMRDLMDRCGHRLLKRDRERVMAVLESQRKSRSRATSLRPSHGMPVEKTVTTGFREFDYERYAAVVVWLCKRLRLVTATSLNKLLFYADFLSFKSEAVSLTGATYIHLDHGPVPAAYGDLWDIMELRGVIEAREVEYQNGHTGVQIRPGPESKSIKMKFSSRELVVLESIVKAFRDKSPSQIRDLSHNEAAYKESLYRDAISYAHASTLSLPVPE